MRSKLVMFGWKTRDQELKAKATYIHRCENIS
jgi:hypothetical protein